MEIPEIDIREAIEAAGGPTRLAKILGLPGKRRTARVSAWVAEGKIPLKVLAEHGDTLKKLIHWYRNRPTEIQQ